MRRSYLLGGPGDDPISRAQELMKSKNVSRFPITDDSNKLVGILTRRDLRFLSAGWPALRARFPTHHSFAEADVPAVLGSQRTGAMQVQMIVRPDSSSVQPSA